MPSRFSLRDRGPLTFILAAAALGLFPATAMSASDSTAPAAPAAPAAKPAQAAPAAASTNAQLPLKVPVTTLFPGGETPPERTANVKKYEGNPVYIAAGKAIFEHYNCSGCHFHGAGGMGPPFMNGGHWIYGGKLDQIFASIYQGRPNGMPSWGRKIPDQVIWEIAAYVKALSLPTLEGPTLPPMPKPKNPVAKGNPDHGAELITANGCGACHTIPGIKNAIGLVGPSLAKMASRATIAGVLPNTPGNMMAWIQQPQSIVPGNAMPNLGLNDNDTRDIAAYLYTLH